MSKGSKLRPSIISIDEYSDKWDQIFSKKRPSDYQDILSTEECVEAALDKMVKINEELGLYKDYK
jgi:hypothetical protein